MKIGIIGGGWRSEFFIRIANQLEEFNLVGILRRGEDKAIQTRQNFNVPAFWKEEDFWAQKPDFVILSIPRGAALEQLHALFKKGVPVLVETPPAASVDELNRLWKYAVSYKPVVLVSEQYFCQPYHSANLRQIASGRLGQVYSMNNSMMHGYHGISMMRKYLGIGMENCRITGKNHVFPITKTCHRTGMKTAGKVENITREVFTLEFDNGQVGFWDFSGEQYFSYIRKRHLMIQGTRGEISDLQHNYLTPENQPVSLDLRRVEMGQYSNMEGYGLRGLMLGEEFLYRNPFEGKCLSDDEIAVATLMCNLREHLKVGTELLYPLREALQDSYLAHVMEQAAEDGSCLSRSQSWI